MTKAITEMTPKNVDVIREILDEGLIEVLDGYGLEVDLGNARYDDDSVKFGFNVKIKGGMSKEMKDLISANKWRGNIDKKFDLEKIAEMNGKKVVLTGFRRRASKKPYIVKNLLDNIDYIVSEEVAERLFGIEDKS